MAAQPNGVVNHPAWIAGHLAYTCELLAGVAGLPPWLPADWADRYGTGSVPVADVKRYESKHELLAVLRDAQHRLVAAVEQVDAARLDEAFPDPAYRDVFPSVRHAFTQVMVGHAAFHVGQVSVWRRAMELRPMVRGFD
jgi:hypothetical protein